MKLLAQDHRKDKQQSYEKKVGLLATSLTTYLSRPCLAQKAMPINCFYHNHYRAFECPNYK